MLQLILVILVLLVAAVPARAQKDQMHMGEKLTGTIIRKDTAPVLHQPPARSTPKTTGDLKLKLERPPFPNPNKSIQTK